MIESPEFSADPNLWKKALAGLLEFRKAEPWAWMPDTAGAFCIDESGQPWFATILGNARQIFGLCLYRGVAGLRTFYAFRGLIAEADPAERLRNQDAVSVWFGRRSELEPKWQKFYDQLGYTPRRGDRIGWPIIRSLSPGYIAGPPNGDELALLADAVPRLLRFALWCKENPGEIDQHRASEIPALPDANSAEPLGSLEWRVWLAPAEDRPPPVSFDRSAPAFRHALSLPQADEALEVHWFYSPNAVVGEGRGYYPRLLMVLRADGGYCFDAVLLDPKESEGEHAVRMILHAIASLGARPIKILVKRPRLSHALREFASSLGAEIETVPFLPFATEFQQGAEARLNDLG